MFTPSRDQARELFFETWRKYRAGEPLDGVAGIALQAILLHPEYHAVLDRPGRYRTREYFPELGETNPFLHLGLHVALAEQLSIDQPAGIVKRYAALEAGASTPHDAMHAAIDCLAEMIWRAQHEGASPDAAAYLACLDKRAGS